MAPNPAIAASWISPSTPPVIIISARPLRMSSIASPMAWVPVAQAAVTVLIGPNALASKLTWWLGMLGKKPVMAKGLTRLNPLLRRICRFSSATSKPPTPVPIRVPTRSALGTGSGRLASSRAMRAAAMANWEAREMRRASLKSIYFLATKSLTSPAMREGRSEASN